MSAGQVEAITATVVAFITVVVAAFRFGSLITAIKSSDQKNTVRFDRIDEKFDGLAKQADTLADLAREAAATKPSEAAWKATTETRLIATEEDIANIRTRLHALGNTIQTVINHQAVADAKIEMGGAK